VRVPKRVTMDGTFDGAADDFGIAVLTISVPYQGRYQQRHIHHQSEHRCPLVIV
jgi:hypothetical protein